jgi:hypothetical protein
MKDKETPKNNSDKKGPNEQFTPNSDNTTKELIQHALVEFLKEKMEEKNTSKKNLESLIGVVEEFLNSFIILGYTFDGTPVQYICAHNQQQADSLATLVNKFFQNALNREEEGDEE